LTFCCIRNNTNTVYHIVPGLLTMIQSAQSQLSIADDYNMPMIFIRAAGLIALTRRL